LPIQNEKQDAYGGLQIFFNFFMNNKLVTAVLCFGSHICNQAARIRVKKTIDETDPKKPKIHMKIYTSLWILKISRKKIANQKSRDFCQIFVISNKNSIA
jgi:hypothetical protein